jgi:hypothetical protein
LPARKHFWWLGTTSVLFVGLINGGIVNGIAGNPDDEPILDTEYGGDWRTAEYWSPHNALYLWAISNLERT